MFAVNLNFLFRLHASEPQTRQGEKALAMSVHTLRMMAKGGIHDHVAKVTSFKVTHYLLSFYYCIFPGLFINLYAKYVFIYSFSTFPVN